MAPGSLHGLQLVVADAAAARQELVDRGVECSEVTVFDERDGGTFFGFQDPDGNSWAVQQIRARAERPLIPAEARGRLAGRAASVTREAAGVLLRCRAPCAHTGSRPRRSAVPRRGRSTMTRTPEEVFAHHGQALGAEDLEDIVADYAEDAILVLHKEVFRGKDGARQVFTRLLGDVPQAQWDKSENKSLPPRWSAKFSIASASITHGLLAGDSQVARKSPALHGRLGNQGL